MNTIKLTSLETLANISDPGSHLEIYFILRKESQTDKEKYPQEGHFTMPSAKGSILTFANVVFEVDTVLCLRLMEADSSSSDDDYGENAIGIGKNPHTGSVIYQENSQNKFKLSFEVS